MSFPEYGKIVEQGATNSPFPEYGEKVEEPSRLRSLLSAFPKGVIKGMQNISPLPRTGGVPVSAGLKLTEKFLPTQERLPEQLLERGGKLGAYLAGGEGTLASKALRAGIGSLAGQTAKELGGGELAQDIAELSSMSFPDLAKNIPAKKAQERVVGFLRKKGFSENEITPLLQSPEKLARTAKFASKGAKTNKLMKDIYQKMGGIYEGIREEGKNLPGLAEKDINPFLDKFQEKLDKIPKFYRRQIKEEIDDLLNSQMKFTDFMDFDQAVNARIKGIHGGKAILGTLKEATSDAKHKINPQLAEDLGLANELYSKRADVTSHLRTRELDDLIDLGEGAAIIAGIADGNMGILKNVLGASGARALARELLINPRLQNISLRMLKAIKQNKIPEAQKLYEIFKKESGKEKEMQ